MKPSIESTRRHQWPNWIARAALLASLGLALASHAQTCAVPGKDGPASPAGVVNSYHGGSGSPGVGSTQITVASATGQRANTRALVAGDLILVMQMQDSATPANAGRHEYAQVVALSGTTLTLNRALSNAYAQSMNTTAVRNWQVVWVPQYSSASIAGTVGADRFSTSASTGVATGGVVAFDVAGSLSLGGTVTAAGAGFRGAFGLNGTANFPTGTATTANSTFTPSAVYAAQKGEGLAGTPPVVFDGTATPVNYLTLLGQGYALGAGGQAAIANAGGGGNDGLPASGGNQYNSGGGGGGNAGAGGQGGNAWNDGNTNTSALNQGTNTNIGNVAGGKGGLTQVNASTRLVMGGGGGAGTANNSGASTVTAWPPTESSTAANGADGEVSGSGAPGGGVVLIRAGSVTGSGVVDASGYRAFNKSPVAATDSAGGGGGGGSIFVTAAATGGSSLQMRARGGAGGSSNYFNHGPGGGGGGGYVSTNLAGATTDVTGGANGTDGCCGGTGGNGSPKAWNASPGNPGATAASGAPTGVRGGASCLPSLTVSKSTSTPTLTSAPGATATYSIAVGNTGGAATNLFLLDQTLPPGWGYTAGTAPTFMYQPAPPPVAGGVAAGAETVSAAAPGALPVTSVASVNSGGAVSLRPAGAAPGLVPANGSNGANFGSFFLPQNASLTVTYAVTIPATATAGTYHNPAGAIFLDPTRTAAAATRMVTPATDAASNRQALAYANIAHAGGATSAVAGANHSGLAAGPTADDVRLLPDFSIAKTAPATASPGSTFTYTLTPRNAGWAVGPQAFATTQATDVALTDVPATFGSNPLTVTDTLPGGVTITGFAGVGWTCSGGATPVCTLPNATAYPIAAGADFASITATATVTRACTGGGTQTNTASVSPATGEVVPSNNTATVTTALTCSTANLQVTKNNGASTVVSGSTVSYTVTVANLGPGAAGGAVVSDAPGAGLSCTAVICSGAGGAVCGAASYPFATFAAGVPIPTLPVGGTATFVVACTVTATGL